MASSEDRDQPTFSRRTKSRKKFHSGELIVRVKEDAIRGALIDGQFIMNAANARRLPGAVAEPIRYLRDNVGLKTVAPVFSHRRKALKRVRGIATKQNLSVLSSVADSSAESLSGISVLSMDEDKIDTALLQTLRNTNAFEYVERAPTRWLSAKKVDPMQNMQWGLRAIRWFQAKPPSARRINVAVLDSGIDTGHPELKSTIDHYERAGLKSTDIIGHGTHVAGTIAALVNNGVGISGVARCQLKVWKVFPDTPDEDGDFFLDNDRYFQALQQVASANCKVVNLSLGGTSKSRTEELLLQRLDRAGIVVVAAMGNEFNDGDPTEYPAAYDTVMAVGSLTQNLRRSSFSNTGDHIKISAPGSDILSTLPRRASSERDETDYAAWSGTSMATPHVAGIVALMLAKNKDLSPADVHRIIKRSAIKLPGMRKRKFSPSYGHGLINLEAALKLV